VTKAVIILLHLGVSALFMINDDNLNNCQDISQKVEILAVAQNFLLALIRDSKVPYKHATINKIEGALVSISS
jgi:hypothetical protein